MGFTIVLSCPIHPEYTAKIAPALRCKACRLLFDVRNNAHKALSTPREERRDLDELLFESVI